jgi:YgiT-type zinc finger domain-containing protein
MEVSIPVMEPDTSFPQTCGQCGSSDLRRETVRSAFWHDDRLVVIDDIPALVCGSCWERYFDDATTMLIDQMRGAGFPPDQARSELRVPVFSLRDRLKR